MVDCDSVAIEEYNRLELLTENSLAMQLQQLILGTWLFLTLLIPVWSSRILFVFPYDMHSQCKLLAPYVEALLDRGHELTIIHAFQDCDVLRRVHSIHVKDKYKADMADYGN